MLHAGGQQGQGGHRCRVGEKSREGGADGQREPSAERARVSAPTLSLPKGGGAIHGIGEKFAANPVTGTASMSVPVPTSPGRSGFGPTLALSYDSGAGNGPFGFGWTLSTASIVRKTDKGLPLYDDLAESDVFILSGAEDLVAVRRPDGSVFDDVASAPGFAIRRYRPRIEGLFARIERWTAVTTGETHWRSITRDNVTTLYGQTNESRVFDHGDADPAHPTRIFGWLICESFDDRGNVVEYGYKAEDATGIPSGQTNETNRTEAQRSAKRYLKSIRYGNTVSRLDSARFASTEWLFEVVLDYGEHAALAPTAGDAGAWLCRNDPFSSYRSGFEIRTYRLCQRFLMFHHFKDEAGVGKNCLVRSLDLRYRSSRGILSDAQRGHPVASFIESVTPAGYRRDGAGGYVRRTLPALEFTYSEPIVSDAVQTIDPVSLENLPVGLDSRSYLWLDLFGEGVSGIFTEQADAWFYKRNLSPLTDAPNGSPAAVRFAPVERVGNRPNVSVGAGGAQLMDLAGDGQPDVVTFDAPMAGFFEVDEREGWTPFRPFISRPTISVADPNLRFIDLDGDGHPDLLVTEDGVFTWYRSLGEDGFDTPIRMPKAIDEEAGPAVVFADRTQSIYLADMSGDGLTDIVRIRNGEVCYWPNIGYGRFGAKVTMDNGPWFDAPDVFDHRRIRVADVDGSGCVDILYLDADGVRLYFNQSGNAWSEPHRLNGFPRIDDLASASTVDLLGNGTACLVWSSPSTAESGQQMRYVDLMGGQKPHLLLKTVNNLGAETVVTYASSAKFYLQDKLAGKPWITKLPFPVHVVERVDTLDRVSGNAFRTVYAYHDGFFDGDEREFRGFGMVEQRDTEALAALADPTKPAPSNVDQASHVPPVHTKTWFHTGVFLGRDRVSNYYAGLLDGSDAGQYYRELAWRDDDVEARRRLLDDTVLPDTILLADGTRTAHQLTSDEEREACRALRGSMLRQEIYGLDGSPKAEHPYTVTEQNFTIELLQPAGPGRHAVFFVHPREAIEHHYERDHEDPRVTHSLTLDVDPFGNVLRGASVAYGRRLPDLSIKDPGDRAEQTRLHVTCAENRFTNVVEGIDVLRAPLPAEARSYELTGLALPAGALRFTFADIKAAVGSAPEIAYEVAPAAGVLQKRLIERVRTRYRPNDLGVTKGDPLALLPLGTLESLALPGESTKMAFTPGLVADVYDARVTDAMLEAEARYVHSEGDANWWIPSGRIFLSPGPADSAAQELAFARLHFFVPRRYRDPFHTTAVSTETSVAYDTYDLLVQETRDPLGNRATAGERDAAGALVVNGNDYRVLQPRLMMDANRNRAAVAFDALGMVVGTAVMGKPAPATAEGDSLSGFEADLTEAVVLAHLANPFVDAGAVLGRASTRLIYDLFAYQRTRSQLEPQPTVVYTLARETHDSDPVPVGGLKIQHGVSYSDGFGREIQKKIQAEPGPVPKRDGAGKIIVGGDRHPVMTADTVSPRWVGTGWTVFNNKGKPVRQFEPFFTDTHRFERDVRIGVSPVIAYDPAGRAVATLQPNHTWGKVAFGPWRQETWDASDLVLVADPQSDPDVGDFFARLPSTDYLPTWHARRAGGGLGPDEQTAARKAAVHAATPSVVHADSLGRAFLTIAHNKAKYSNTPDADPPAEDLHRTRVVFDIEGNQREVIDAKNRVVMRYAYDMLGTRIHQLSMEAGARWTLNDVAGKPLYAWDSRDHRFRSGYDALRRTTDSFLKEGAGAELVIGHVEYGDGQPSAEAANLRGKVVEAFDQAGVVVSDSYDFKGNLLHSRRQLAHEYSKTLDWSVTVSLDAPKYSTRTRYDALNRPVQVVAPHSDQPDATVNVIQSRYTEANLLGQVDAWLNLSAEPADMLAPATASLHAVTNIDHDAKGQREAIDYGNGVTTTYTHDPETVRLTRLLTRGGGRTLQDLNYVYDSGGNITRIRDDAQQTIFFSNKRVEPSNDYTYDALNRLIEATGREHLGQVGADPTPSSYNDVPRVGIDFARSDGTAMGRYLERYVYDAVGNFESMKHIGTDPAKPGWKREYLYDEPSLTEASKRSNRLTSTSVVAAPEVYSKGGDGYDPHGNMLRMPHLQEMRWDFKDQLRMTRRQKVNAADADGEEHDGERTWYVYDAGGERVRKVTEASPGTIKEEHAYLGGFEVFRRVGANAIVRETLHLMDNGRRVALVETRTAGERDDSPPVLIRFQLGNQLGSAALELDGQARIISYEEYTPYGDASYEAVRSQTETAKRYRYSGKERDEETGFTYHGMRYCAAWLGRWTSADPAGLTDGPNLFQYAHANPVRCFDPTGTTTEEDKGLLSGFGARLWQMASTPSPGAKAFKEGRYADFAKGIAGDTALAMTGLNMIVDDYQLAAAAVQVPGQIADAVMTPRNDAAGAKTADAFVTTAAVILRVAGPKAEGILRAPAKAPSVKAPAPVADPAPVPEPQPAPPGPPGSAALTPPVAAPHEVGGSVGAALDPAYDVSRTLPRGQTILSNEVGSGIAKQAISEAAVPAHASSTAKSPTPIPSAVETEKFVQSAMGAGEQSYTAGQPAASRSKDSVRPDSFRGDAPLAVDGKNYKIETGKGRSNLINELKEMAAKWTDNLPLRTKEGAGRRVSFGVAIEMRGRALSDQQLHELVYRITKGTDGAFGPLNIWFIF
jgi:RHS repeat-associated protein